MVLGGSWPLKSGLWRCFYSPTDVRQDRNYNFQLPLALSVAKFWRRPLTAPQGNASFGVGVQLVSFYSSDRTAMSVCVEHFFFLLLLLGEKLSGGKEMLKVTPKMGLGTWQTEPKCLTNRQQIGFHTAYSESTICNLSWPLCLHLPHTHAHTHAQTVNFTACIMCVCDVSVSTVCTPATCECARE